MNLDKNSLIAENYKNEIYKVQRKDNKQTYAAMIWKIPFGLMDDTE
jgi:hypothetical protein